MFFQGLWPKHKERTLLCGEELQWRWYPPEHQVSCYQLLCLAVQTLTFTGNAQCIKEGNSVRCLELSYASVVRSWHNSLPYLATPSLLTRTVQPQSIPGDCKNRTDLAEKWTMATNAVLCLFTLLTHTTCCEFKPGPRADCWNYRNWALGWDICTTTREWIEKWWPLCASVTGCNPSTRH